MNIDKIKSFLFWLAVMCLGALLLLSPTILDYCGFHRLAEVLWFPESPEL